MSNNERDIIRSLCPSTFYLDIIWTDEDGIRLKTTKGVHFNNVVYLCSYGTDLFQSDSNFDLMSHYFRILNKMEEKDKMQIKRAISNTICSISKKYLSQNK